MNFYSFGPIAGPAVSNHSSSLANAKFTANRPTNPSLLKVTFLSTDHHKKLDNIIYVNTLNCDSNRKKNWKKNRNSNRNTNRKSTIACKRNRKKNGDYNRKMNRKRFVILIPRWIVKIIVIRMFVSKRISINDFLLRFDSLNESFLN